MNKIRTIVKYAFKEEFFAFNPKKKIANYPKNYLGRLIMLLWTYLFLGYIFYGIMKGAMSVYANQGDNAMYFTTFAIFVALIILLIYGPKIYASFFVPKAISDYQTMPIGEGELFVGKLIGAVLSFFDFFIFFLLGLFIYFGATGFDLSVLIFGIINFFPMVFVPYSLITLIILIVKKFTNVNRHKKLMKNLGYVLMFIFIGVIYYFAFSSGYSSGQSGETSGFWSKFSLSFAESLDRFKGVSNIFLQAKLFGLAVGGSILEKIIGSLVLIGICLVLGLIIYKLADKYYYEAVFENDALPEKKTKETKKKREVSLVKSSQFMAIYKRDLRIVTSNLMFLYTPILMILIFGMMSFTTGRQIVKDIDPNSLNTAYARLMTFGASFLMGVLIWVNGSTASTSLSREGKGFYIFQTMPIDPKSHMRARLLSAMTVSTVINLIMALVVGFLIKIGFVNTLMIFLGLSLASFVSNIVGVYLASININTNWKTPKDLLQGGAKTIGFYFGSMIVVGIILGLFILILSLTEGNIYLASGACIILVGVITFIFYRLARSKFRGGFLDK